MGKRNFVSPTSRPVFSDTKGAAQMRFGMGVPKSFTAPRRETRIPMEVGVQIAGHATVPGTEATFTENVSPRGARVLSARRWKKNDRLTISTQQRIVQVLRASCLLRIGARQWVCGGRGIFGYQREMGGCGFADSLARTGKIRRPESPRVACYPLAIACRFTKLPLLHESHVWFRHGA